MKHSVKAILVLLLLVSGCKGDPYRRVYETIKNRDDGFKSPAERAMTPTPNYGTYRSERDHLRHKEPTTDKQIFTEHKKFDEKHDFNTMNDDKTQDALLPQCTGSCLGTSSTTQFNRPQAQ